MKRVLIRRWLVGSLATSLSLCGGVSALSAWDEGLDREMPAVVARVGGDISYLASDELGGRGVGTEGIEKAAAHIRDEFQRLGLTSGVEDGSYFQPFNVEGMGAVVAEKTSAVLVGPDGTEHALGLGSDFQPQLLGGKGPVEAELVFAGYGIIAPDLGYDDFANLDVNGKIVVVIRREPQADDENSKFDGKETSRYALIRSKLSAAATKGAIGLVLVNDAATAPEADRDALAAPELFGTSGDSIPFIHLTRKRLDEILAASPVTEAEGKTYGSLKDIEATIDSEFRPVVGGLGGWKLRYQTEVETVTTSNVIGVLEGEGPLASETIVIGAHYDHLGMGGFGSRTPDRVEIHNGADDNATGTAAVLELARRFATAEGKPRRRMVFIAFSAEERGLIGSTHFVANPTVPIENIVAMVNFDMIGWLRNDALTVYGVGSSPNFETMVKEVGTDTGLDLKPVAGGFAGSDHLPFISKQIPAVFMHTGLNATYHTPDDDFETIDVEGASRVIDYSEKLIQRLVDLEERPPFQAAAPSQGRRRMAYLGARIDFAEDVMGLKVAEVTEESPASRAGLAVGDVVVAIADKELKTREDLIALLQEKKAGDVVTVKLRRGEEEISVEVTLERTPRQ